MQHRSLYISLSLAALATLGLTRALVAQVPEAAARISNTQADIIGDNAHNGEPDSDPNDGGWDFIIDGTDAGAVHTASASPNNTYGITGLGALLDFVKNGTGRSLITCIDCFSGMVLQSGAPDRGPDYAFAEVLSKATASDFYAEVARDRWITKLASFGGARAFGELIRDSRHSQNFDGLIPWDINLYILSGVRLEKKFGNTPYDFRSDILEFANVIEEDLNATPPLFDHTDSAEEAYNLGLAGALMALKVSRTGDAALRDDIRSRLLAQQKPSGAWPYNDVFTGDDEQTTAYVIIAFSILGNDTVVRAAGADGSAWLVSVQAAHGGWDLGGSGTEVTEVDSECAVAIARIRPSTPLLGPPSRNADELHRQVPSTPLDL